MLTLWLLQPLSTKALQKGLPLLVGNVEKNPQLTSRRKSYPISLPSPIYIYTSYLGGPN